MNLYSAISVKYLILSGALCAESNSNIRNNSGLPVPNLFYNQIESNILRTLGATHNYLRSKEAAVRKVVDPIEEKRNEAIIKRDEILAKRLSDQYDSLSGLREGFNRVGATMERYIKPIDSGIEKVVLQPATKLSEQIQKIENDGLETLGKTSITMQCILYPDKCGSMILDKL